MRLLGPIFLLFAANAFAQNAPLQCQTNVAVTPTVRVEGLTDSVGDIVLNCTGGATPAAGQFYPQANIAVTLNTTITSRLIGPGNATDAVMLIDDPALGTQFLAPSSLTNIVSTGAAYSPSYARPNVFQGLIAAPNQVVFNGVPILAPETAGITRRYRITNLRANAAQLGVGGSILGTVSMVNSSTFQPVPLTNPQQVVALVGRGLNFFVSDQQSASSGATSAQRFGVLHYQEGFPTAFKTRVVATSPSAPDAAPIGQGVPGTIVNSESGLLVDGGAGLVERGTQLIANFDNVPPGAQIYVAGQNLSTDGSQVARAVTSSTGPIQLAPLNSVGYVQLFPDANGRASGVWEVLKSDPKVQEGFSLPIDIIYPGTPLAASRVIRVTGSLGPNPVFTSYLNSQSSFSSGFGFGFFDVNGTLRSPFDYLPVNSQPLAEIRTTDTTNAGLIASFSQCQLRNEQAPFASFATSGCDGYIGSGSIRATGLVPTVVASNQPGVLIPQSIPSSKSELAAASSWLTANLDQTVTPARLLITANPTGLVPGTYSGRVTVTSITAGVGQVQIPVTYTVRPTNIPKVISFGLTNAASYANNVVAPGEAVVIFGVDFGPTALATLKLTNNVVDTVLGGTRVLFDGVPAPMIYAVKGQISCFVPFSVTGKTFVQMEVEQDGVKSDPVTMAVAAAVPGILTANLSGSGQGSILNDDYFSNADHSALPGHYVFIYGTGAGQTSPAAQDGHLNGGTSTLVNTPVKVFLDGVELPNSAIQYAGPAPSLVEGVFQVNIKLPDNVRRGDIPVVIQFGSFSTQPGVTINTR